MGARESLAEEVSQIPEVNDVRRRWYRDIRREERAGHESEFDSDSFEYDISELETRAEDAEQDTNCDLSPFDGDTLSDSEEDEAKIELTRAKALQPGREGSDMDGDLGEDAAIAELQTQRDGKRMMVYDQFGTKCLITQVLECLISNQHVIVGEDNETTLHMFLDVLLSQDMPRRLLVVALQEQLGGLLEKHGTDNIALVTDTTNITVGGDKVYLLSANKARDWVYKGSYVLIVKDDNCSFFHEILKHKDEVDGQIVLFTRLRGKTQLEMIRAGFPQPCTLFYDRSLSINNETPQCVDFNHCIGLNFKSLQELHTAIVFSAAKIGFKIIAKDGLTGRSTPVRFLCDRSSTARDKKSKATKKNDCPWMLKAARRFDGWEITDCINTHGGHELNPRATVHLTLTSQQIQLIQALKEQGTSSKAISKVLQEIYDNDIILTWRQIRAVGRKPKSHVRTLETSELITQLDRIGAHYRVLEENKENRRTRIAILTFTQTELLNLSRYGDVIFVDGTKVPSRIEWQCFPITVMDNGLTLQPGGVMFAARATGEIFEWFLSEMTDVMVSELVLKHGRRVPRMETIVTDEDLAIMKAIDSYNMHMEEKMQICHVICFWHKMKNFEKKLTTSRLSEEAKSEAKTLFERIGLCPSKEIVQQCLTKLKNMSGQLNVYVESNVEPLLTRFARAYIDGFTLGYNVSSLSESTNSLFKRDMRARNYTLAQVRFEIIEAFRHKNAVQKYNELNSRHRPCLLRELYGLNVCPKVRDVLLASLLKSYRLERSGDVYYDPKFPDEKYRVLYPVCDCNKLKFQRLPCSHIMRYSLEKHINPMTLVDGRYMGENRVPLAPWTQLMMSREHIVDYVSEHGTKSQKELISRESSRVPQLTPMFNTMDGRFREENLREQLRTPVANNPDGLTVIQRFNLIVAEAKEVARRASQSQDRTDELVSLLREKWRQYSHVAEDEDSQITEAVGATVGRPRKSRIRAASEGKPTKQTKKRFCAVCDTLGLNASHPQGICRNALRLWEIGTSKCDTFHGKQCQLCGQRGHNSRTCPNLAILSREISKCSESSTICTSDSSSEVNSE